MTVQEGAGPGPKKAASPPKKVQFKLLKSLRESSDSDEEPEHEQAYFVLAQQMEQPISDEKVDMPHVDVKSDFGIKFIPRTMNLIAYSNGHQEQFEIETAKSPTIAY